MKIKDYETGNVLRDGNIELTRYEAEELAAYLNRMINREDLKTIHLTDLNSGMIEQELSVSLNDSASVA